MNNNSTGGFRYFMSNGGSDSAVAPRRDDSAGAIDVKLRVTNVSAINKVLITLTIKAWATIKDVKDQIFSHVAIPQSAQRLFLGGPLQNYGRELPNHWTLHDASIVGTSTTIQELFLLDTRNNNMISTMSRLSFSSDISVTLSMQQYTPKALLETIQKSRAGFAGGFKPVLVYDGSGGTYFLHDAYKAKIGVFKPADEEPYAENNPRGYVNTNKSLNNMITHSSFFYDEKVEGTTQMLSLRAGINPGESCLREVAAYLLDHDGFSGVPPTTLVEARHEGFHISGTRLKVCEGGASIGSHFLSSPSDGATTKQQTGSTTSNTKIGSFQEFVNAECTMDDLSPSKISVEEIHKIAILDIRLMNADRNSANLLCRRRKSDNMLELVPIDHGYCLRSVCDVSWFDWCWLDWPQVKKPLSNKMKEYVMNLDIEKDVQILKDLLKIDSLKALNYFRASCMLLKAGVKAGLCLYDIAHLCCRNDDMGELPSKLEMLIEKSRELAISAVENGRWHQSAALRALEHQLAASRNNVPLQEMTSGTHPNSGLLSPYSSNKMMLLKSASSADFSLIEKRKLDAGIGNTTATTSFTTMYHQQQSSIANSLPESENTSGSDSDREEEEEDDEHAAAEDDLQDCEQWAASIIADVSLDVSRRNRSFSDSSSSNSDRDSGSSLSQSPPGFWQIHPGSTSTGGRGHLESINWSEAEISSNTKSNDDNNNTRSGNSISPISVANDTSIPTTTNTETLLEYNKSTTPPPKAGHDEITFSPIFPLSPPMSMMLSPPNKSLEGLIKRSQSYCALSLAPRHDIAASPGNNRTITAFSKNIGNNTSSSLLTRSAANFEQLYEYSLKFVDLLITREIFVVANKKISI